MNINPELPNNPFHKRISLATFNLEILAADIYE